MFTFLEKVLNLFGPLWRASLIIFLACAFSLHVPLASQQLQTLRAGVLGAGLFLAEVLSGVALIVLIGVAVDGWLRRAWKKRWGLKVLTGLSHRERWVLHPLLRGGTRIAMYPHDPAVKTLERKGILRLSGHPPREEGTIIFEVERWAVELLESRFSLLEYDKKKLDE